MMEHQSGGQTEQRGRGVSANDDRDMGLDQPNPDQEVAHPSQPIATSPCPHCGQPISPYVRRCPHCQQAIAANRPIARPEKSLPSEGGAAWHEAAAQIADLGDITWHDDGHPINLDTHPFTAEAAPTFSPYAEEADQALTPPIGMRGSVPPPRRPPSRWGVLGGGMFFLLALLGFVLVVARQQQQSAAQLAAAATHQAALTNGSHGGNGNDKFTPQPTARPIQGGATATATASGTATLAPSPTPTLVPTATATPTPIPTATPIPPPMLVYAINAGSSDASGAFVGDEFFTGGSAAHTSANIDTSKVAVPAPMQIYQSCRYGQFSYALPKLVPGAPYMVELHFADSLYKHAGQQAFSVTANGTLELNNFDVNQQAGGRDIALMEKFVVTADQYGLITLNFSRPAAVQAVASLPQVNGIEIYTAGPAIGG